MGKCSADLAGRQQPPAQLQGQMKANLAWYF